MSKKDGTVEIDCKIKQITERAYLIDNGKYITWIPRSQITDQTGDGYSITSIFIPEWLAIDKGLV